MSDETIYSGKKGRKSTFGNNKRPKASQRRPLNCHELEAPDNLNASTSEEKLKQSEDLYDIEIYHSEMKLTESDKRGLGFKLLVACENCEKTEISSCSFVNKGYEINRRIVLAKN
ncbi:hypothetical protein HHI36_008486, partial [Cryptolaemus montrouzieri]